MLSLSLFFFYSFLYRGTLHTCVSLFCFFHIVIKSSSHQEPYRFIDDKGHPHQRTPHPFCKASPSTLSTLSSSRSPIVSIDLAPPLLVSKEPSCVPILAIVVALPPHLESLSGIVVDRFYSFSLSHVHSHARTPCINKPRMFSSRQHTLACSFPGLPLSLGFCCEGFEEEDDLSSGTSRMYMYWLAVGSLMVERFVYFVQTGGVLE